MKNKLIRKGLILAIIVETCGLIFSPAIFALEIENEHAIDKSVIKQDLTMTSGGYINTTVEEAWKMISNSSNGIQILVDVRTPIEYINERIYTPSLLEKPRLFPLQVIEREGLLLCLFTMMFKDREIILYCRSSNRSAIAAQILVDFGMTGKIYNMVGGINAWKLEELPTVRSLSPFNFGVIK